LNRFCRDLILATGALACATALAAPSRVEAFDTAAWAKLHDSAASPAVVVFTTTDCAYCPAVIDSLAREIRRRQLDASLVAVVMDAAPGEADAALLADADYRPADRLFAFAGPERTLRHAVNPQWRGITPYVGFVAPSGEVRWVLGTPSAGEVQGWAAQVAARR
jgi:hypothetical protein